jgi:pyroglutamyl-peptidase
MSLVLPDTLLLGFDAFGGLDRNPSQEIVALAAQRKLCQTGLLPTSYRRASKTLADYISSREYKVVILLGYARSAKSLRLEQFAHNLVRSHQADNDGQALAGEPVLPQGSNRYETSLPIKRLQKTALARGLQVELSQDAGGFVCNYVYYMALWLESHNQDGRRTVFIHVPDLADRSMLTEDCLRLIKLISGE